MLTYTRYSDRAGSDLMYRFGTTRRDRYLKDNPTKEMAVMPRIFKEYLTHFTKGKECSKEVKRYAVETIKIYKNKKYQNGLIALYEDQYIIVFLNVDGLDASAIKLTHNNAEKKLLEAFMSGSSNVALDTFYMICLRMLFNKQRISLIKERATEGIIYCNYPEEDIYVSDGFIEYTNTLKASSVAGSKAITAISDALDRGCTKEEISDILPTDALARFFAREYDEYELAQIEALEHNISARA